MIELPILPVLPHWMWSYPIVLKDMGKITRHENHPQTWWRHQLEHFPCYLAFATVPGIHRSPVNSHHKGQRRGALILSLICAWTNGCINNRDAGDVMKTVCMYTHDYLLRQFCWCILKSYFHIEILLTVWSQTSSHRDKSSVFFIIRSLSMPVWDIKYFA